MLRKSAKRMMVSLLVVVMLVTITGCGSTKTSVFMYNKTAADLAKWTTMETPSEGSGSGTVTLGDNAVIIKAAADGWGGVQSEKMTLDLSKSPILMVQIKENADGFKWGAKFVPSDPAVEDHAWGFYLFEDNNFKYNNYAAVDIKEKLGEAFIDAYGEQVEGVLWIFASGSPDATVEVTSVKMFEQE